MSHDDDEYVDDGEMYDDDDGNYKVTPHKDYDHYIVNDDKFVHTLPITWEGWKVVAVMVRKTGW